MRRGSASELRLDRFLELSADPVVVVDGEGRIVTINQLAEALFGFTVDDLRGKSLGVLLPERFHSAHEQHLREYFRGPQTRPMGLDVELTALCNDGSELPVEIRLHPIEENGSTFVVASVRDVTYRRHMAEQLMQRNVALERETAAREVAEADLKDLGQKMLTAQEDDRARIARELLDDVSQRLAVAMIGLEMSTGALDEDPTAAKEHLRALRERLDQVSGAVHEVSRELHPDVLHNLGLETALEVLCEEFQSQSGAAAKPRFEGPTPELSDEVALCIYRVSQEALQNVAKHAKANAVDLDLTTTDEHARLRIRDDGVGFDPDSREPGLGLASIRERARLLDGTVRLDTRPGSGTELIIEIPITEVTR